MKDRQIVPVIISVFFILIFSGCSVISEYAQKPSINFKTLRIKDPGLFDATLVFVFDVKNPNPLGGRISSATYDLDVDGKNFIEGVLDKGINLPANGKAEMEIPVRVNYLDFFDSVKEFTTRDKVNYKLSGDLTVLAFKIPYKTSGQLDIPELPEVKLKKVRTGNISLTGGEIVFVVEMKNKSNQTINLKGLDYGISLGGIDFGTGRSTISRNISGNGITEVQLPVDVDILRLGNGVMNILKKESTNYGIKGEMELEVPGVGTKKFPYDRSGSVELD